MYDFTKIPLDKITKFGHTLMMNNDVFCVSWILGRYCNFSCSYCWPYARSDEKDHRPFELLIKTMDEIKKQSRENGFNSFWFSFSGGEPTLHPNFLDLLSYYASDDKSNFQATHMTTNMSRGLKWFEKYVEATKTLNKQNVTGSWHREFAKKDQFAEKCLFLIENDIQVTINMVMVVENFYKIYEEAEWFYNQGINVTLKPQSDPTAQFVVDGYTQDMIEKMQNGFTQRYRDHGKRQSTGIKIDDTEDNYEIEMFDNSGNRWLMDQAERFNSFNFNKFTGWTCNAGYQSLIIREPCGSIKRSYSCSDKPIGNIKTGFQIFNEPKKCISFSCVSSADSKIPKIKN